MCCVWSPNIRILLIFTALIIFTWMFLPIYNKTGKSKTAHFPAMDKLISVPFSRLQHKSVRIMIKEELELILSVWFLEGVKFLQSSCPLISLRYPKLPDISELPNPGCNAHKLYREIHSTMWEWFWRDRKWPEIVISRQSVWLEVITFYKIWFVDPGTGLFKDIMTIMMIL